MLDRECLASRVQSYKDGIAENLVGLAEVASLTGQPKRAAFLCGMVEALDKENHTSLPPRCRAAYDRIVEDIRGQLNDTTFAEAWIQGQAMSREWMLAATEALETSELVSSRLASPSLAREAASQRVSPHRLTAREVQVLRLVTQGLTDPQIAAQLGISSRTVHRHVSSILNKVDVNSRSAATRYALENKLV